MASVRDSLPDKERSAVIVRKQEGGACQLGDAAKIGGSSRRARLLARKNPLLK